MQKLTLSTMLKKRVAAMQPIFIPYMMAGDGGLNVLHERITFLSNTGADAIEIGIPFSDPSADGEVIQQAGSRALAEGVTLRRVLRELEKQEHSVPLIIMTYLNPVLAMGVHLFIESCERAGIKGLIIPDLPFEERQLISDELQQVDLALVPLISLTSSSERIQKIATEAEGFIYALTVNGTTGERSEFECSVANHLTALKRVTDLPVLAGFGISTAEHIRYFQSLADGVIIGSSIVEAFHLGDLEKIDWLARIGRNTVEL